MRCIICLQEKTPGNEHVIAYSLGGSFTIDRVCTGCDNALGNRVDAGLINYFQIEQRRHALRLRGHNGSVPDPLGKVAKSTFVGIEDKKHRIKFVRDPSTGNLRPWTMPRVVFDVERHPNNLYRIELKECYIDAADGNKAETYVKSALRKQGVKDETVLNEAWRLLSVELNETVEHKTFSAPFEVRVGGHQLGILKIAYEMAWYWLGDDWLTDPVAKAMREGLNDNVDGLARVKGKLFDDPNAILMVSGGDTRLIHAVYMFPGMNKFFLGMRLFDVMSAAFVVTDTASQYNHPPSDAIIMQNVDRTFQETTFAKLLGIDVER